MSTPESLLLKRIEEELIAISEAQHVQARHAAVLRKARTLLHVGCSTIEVNAMLGEHQQKERMLGASSVRSRPVRKPAAPGPTRVALLCLRLQRPRMGGYVTLTGAQGGGARRRRGLVLPTLHAVGGDAGGRRKPVPLTGQCDGMGEE